MGCTALSLYDHNTGTLTEWGEKLRDLDGDVDSSTGFGLLVSGQTTREELAVACEREGIDPDSLDQTTREGLEAAETVRDEKGFPERCPHPPRGDGDHCIFHLPERARDELEDGEIEQAFFERIEAVEDGYTTDLKQFVGARLPELHLDYRRVDSGDNRPIDLRFAEIGSLRLDDGIFHQELRFDHATIVHDCSCTSADFQKRVSFEGADIRGDDITFEKCRFEGVAAFEDATWTSDTVTFEKCRFEDVAEFAAATFETKGVSFEKAHFEMEASFDGASFVIDTSGKIEHVNFEKTVFLDDFSFGNVSVRRPDPNQIGPGIKVSFRNAHSTGNEVTVNGTFGTFEQKSQLQPEQPVSSDNSEINKVTFKGADFSDGVFEMTSARVAGDLDLEDVDLTNADVECNEMRIYEGLDTTNASFSNGEVLFNNTVVHDRTKFTNVGFVGNKRISFEDARFLSNAEFGNSQFDADECDFAEVTVEGNATFDDVDVDSGKLDFSESSFGEASFHNVGMKCKTIDMAGLKVTNSTTFKRAELDVEEATFADSTFGGSVDFSNSTFIGDISFNGARFLGQDIDFSNLHAESADLQFVDTRTTLGTAESDESGAPIRFHEATVVDGVFRQPRDARVTYDFEGATVGDIRLEFDDDTDDECLFEYFRFRESEFDGFDFSYGDYRTELKENQWEIHTAVVPDGSGIGRRIASRVGEYASLVRRGPDPEYDPDTLESTYRKAKIGADESGDSEASSQFFQKELAYRRRSHGYYTWVRSSSTNGSDPSISERLGRAWLWVTNTILWLISGYGERPKRVIISSFATIGLFALLYELTWYALELSPPDSVRETGPAFILSAEMFTAIILGGGEVANTVVRMISYVEGFVGSLFIALFVLTITRAVRR